MPRVRITEDSLWYSRSYRKGDTVLVEGQEYLDLLVAGRVEPDGAPGEQLPGPLSPREIEGRHRSEVILVFGNGPSLELARGREHELAAFTTIGVNRTFALLKTTYILFLDASFWAAHERGILQSGSRIFCPDRLRLPFFTRFGRYRPGDSRDVLSERFADGLYWSRSSTVPAVNLAYLFGASAVALLGVDLRDDSHFYSERGRGRPFLHADMILEDLWRLSRKLTEKGVGVFNCSPESAVRGFGKMGLGELLALAGAKKREVLHG